MPHAPTEIVQSFRLRFWWEPRAREFGDWRGTVWHEQQERHEKPIAVGSPEEAFELVRRALQMSAGSQHWAEPRGDRPRRTKFWSLCRRIFGVNP